MRVKRLKITNRSGAGYDLMPEPGTDGVYCYQMAGFGYDAKGTYSQIGNSFTELGYAFEQHKPKGQFVFYSHADPFELYFEFMRFLSDRPLTIQAVNFADKEYYLDVNVASVTKETQGSNRAVMAEIKFEALGLFYTEPKTITTSGEVETYKPTYPAMRNTDRAYGLPESLNGALHYLNSGEVKAFKKAQDFYIYPSTERGEVISGATYYIDGDTVTKTNTGTLYMEKAGMYPVLPTTFVRYESDSYIESPCRLEIYAAHGDVVNPRWYHYVDDELVSQGKYNGIIPEGDRLVVDTSGTTYSIKEYNQYNEYVGDRYELCDFNTDRFVFVMHGVNVYSVSHDGTVAVEVIITPRVEYESV